MKELAKAVVSGVARVAAIPWLVSYWLMRPCVGRDKALHSASQGLSLWPGLSGEYVRREFYRMTLEFCAKDACISFGTIFSKQGARIGHRAYIGPRCTLGLVAIGDDALLASNVDVPSGANQHGFADPNIPIREQGGVFTRVTIGADTWIGNGSVVLADVGKGSVVGASSVVVRSIPEGVLAVGAPARVVGRRGENTKPVEEPHDVDHVANHL